MHATCSSGRHTLARLSLQDMLTVGAATTIAELAEVLCTLGGTAAGGPSAPFDTLAATLKRVAGTHVRNAASVGGNLVLARCVVACMALHTLDSV